MDAPEAKVFEGEDVTGTKGNFTYLNTQYWVPGHDYYFAATAPAQSENIVLTTPATGEAAKLGLGVVDFTVTDGAEDFLYSAVGLLLHRAQLLLILLSSRSTTCFQR